MVFFFDLFLKENANENSIKMQQIVPFQSLRKLNSASVQRLFAD
jgi:hypothetical protein